MRIRSMSCSYSATWSVSVAEEGTNSWCRSWPFTLPPLRPSALSLRGSQLRRACPRGSARNQNILLVPLGHQGPWKIDMPSRTSDAQIEDGTHVRGTEIGLPLPPESGGSEPQRLADDARRQDRRHRRERLGIQLDLVLPDDDRRPRSLGGQGVQVVRVCPDVFRRPDQGRLQVAVEGALKERERLFSNPVAQESPTPIGRIVP